MRGVGSMGGHLGIYLYFPFNEITVNAILDFIGKTKTMKIISPVIMAMINLKRNQTLKQTAIYQTLRTNYNRRLRGQKLSLKLKKQNRNFFA